MGALKTLGNGWVFELGLPSAEMMVTTARLVILAVCCCVVSCVALSTVDSKFSMVVASNGRKIENVCGGTRLVSHFRVSVARNQLHFWTTACFNQ